MKALLLLIMFLISTTVFSQQTDGREDGTPAVKGSPVVVLSDSLIPPQSSVIDHEALAKSYKDKSRKYGIAALVLGVAGIGMAWYGAATYELDFDFSGMTWEKMNTNGRPYTRSTGVISDDSPDNTLSDAMMVVGTACVVSAVVCCIKSITYHRKAGAELKLSVKGTTASIALTF
ncbi:hypothetical protein [Bacteroides sedimenti]|uniref:DUF4134 domain-containing protein n=1 Tax=Bacteroides sedimenti TaxID=2136147 RepID=A0ABM8ID16_9BACE